MLVCGSTIALAACAQTLDADKVETAIKTDLGKQAGLAVKAIHCPSDIKQAQGRSFECTGELEPDGGFFVTVQQQDDRGTVVWDVPNSWRLLNLATLEAQFQQVLQTQHGSKPTVNCGGRYRATKPGDSFECRLTRRTVPAKTASNRAAETRAAKTDPAETIVIQVQPEGNIT
ncbi:MAG: DUF4333 domain-containing protein [Tildeniella nuda ZEHNDER 1965/U140]|jgi:hypothetical protein|nr:DUF4333 domain-containing protein [Tildeniella nuda ZEHNDER 1965/U140]